MRGLWRWWRGDPEALERAKQADDQAGQHLAEARKNGRQAKRLLTENHLTERFIRELRHKGHA